MGLVGSDAFIEDSTALGSNSALTGLASIGAGALFALHDQAKVSTTGALANDGQVYLDPNAGDGGSSLTLAGALTNSGDLVIGNTTLSAPDEVTAASVDNTGKIYLIGSSADQALLDVAGSAGFGTAGVLSGYARLAGDSAIEFESGEITSLAAGSHLGLVGSDAFIEDSTATGSNSALMGLASIGTGALFALHDGATVSTNGALVNDGQVYLDPNDGNGSLYSGEGGSSLNIGGALTNYSEFGIGNRTLSASDEVTATSLDNTGKIQLTGQGQGANQALLDVTTGVAGFGTAGVLSGNVDLSGDSAIEFASGQITSLAANAQLSLNGTNGDPFIEDSTALGSNSALTGLASIGAGATFDLEYGAAVSTTGALVNDGTVDLDAVVGYGGGSSLTVAGALTNNGSVNISHLYISIGSDEVTATSLDNTGHIGLAGSYSQQYQALLDVTAGSAGFGTAGVLSGSVYLNYDSAIEFLSGQISTIAAGSDLDLIGNDAFIEDSTALGSNSALTGLSDIAGSLTLAPLGAASVSTTGALTNSGVVSIGGTGSTLSIGGALTNSGMLSIYGLASVTAKSFVNSGTVNLISGQALLDVSGTTTNNGGISIRSDTEELAGAVGGTGSINLKNANLQFDASVSSGQTITETGADALTLNEAQSFAATIKGFGTGDTIDATNFVETATSYSFLENSMGTGGTLTLHDASLTANILMTGVYSNSNFSLAHDSGTGTLVKFV